MTFKINMDLNFIVNGIIYKIIHDFKIFNLNDEDIRYISEQAKLDAIAFSEKDPSAKNNPNYIAICYSTYFSVVCYRIASLMYKKERYDIAKLISEKAKVKTGIEIHPACKIGKRFVIDHGMGTVIGETCVIGDDCYILQSVTLGASKIANNKDGKRHPSIGNNVEVAGFVNLIGNIKIGDNVKISPRVIVRESIPDNSKVINISNIAVVR
ncbi:MULTISPECIES: serine O-acetyltransferase [Xenorhabdus]|uniref:serine O-acetyltransferase n=1 Tax=Xenorhabdus TaxID=626 RepID=UPI0006498E2D|nr:MULTISPECIES: serine O-acetyltransferase [Xenorhabdus]KLU14614.1 serine acetyltransferase [Xenorhabdus griffiniae]KOP32512.1 serine acetyltransferase [Xenorhabdus sp. GDc328]